MAVFLLDLADDECAAYGTIIRALEHQTYAPPAITDQVVADIEALAAHDPSLVHMGRRLVHLLQETISSYRT